MQPPAGGPGDAPDAETVHAIGERKNADLRRRIQPVKPLTPRPSQPPGHELHGLDG